MFKRNYKISGFTQNLIANWKGDFRDDLQFFIDRKTGEIYAKLSLNIFEAMMMRRSMKKYNLKHPCVLQLKKCKGKRYRV